MKKFAFSALLAATLLGATEYNYEISPVAGYVFSNDGQHLDNQSAFGAEIQYNGFDSVIKPELSVLYSDADFENSTASTDIFRTALNGVYEYTESNGITPFAKMGLGYETMDQHNAHNTDSLFADVGAGVKIGLMEQLALKLEAVYMAKFNDFNWDNNLALLGGVTYAFGEKAQPAAPAPVVEAPKPAPAPVVEAPKPAPVVEAPKPAPVEKCANAPKGFVLDDNCEPLKKSLNINFPFDSSAIIDTEAPKVTDFATFMKDSPAYKVDLVGHTDSTGTDEYNQKLSEKRAAAVKAELEKDGIAGDRINTSGKGETDPVATNKTKEGRWLNRRVDAVLVK